MMRLTAIFVGVIYLTFLTCTVTLHSSSSEHIEQNTKTDVPLLNDRPDHLFWFIQISDIHISIFHDEQRIDNFEQFVTETLNTIKPPVVLASGDLTDARDVDFIGARQYVREWQIYNDILARTNVKNRTLWMDIKGNHDNFNVPISMVNNTYFNQYSIQGSKHKRSYMNILKGSDNRKYAFIAVDSSLPYGLKRPFNFIGMLTSDDTKSLQSLANEAKSAGADFIVWFGHYPTSCIANQNQDEPDIKQIIGNTDGSLAYLCGHLHTLAGMVPKMYALHDDKFLELEVADWKSCRKYRVAAVDGGLFSFVDVDHDQWPIVLITNPKHSLFRIPSRGESQVQLESTHIRLLAFSPAGISHCDVSIGTDFNVEAKQVNDNFFVAPWDPKHYQEGLHKILVRCSDKLGRKTEVSQPFRLDDKKSLNFDALANIVLHVDVRTILKSFSWAAFALCVAPLLFFRGWHELVLAGVLGRRRVSCRTPMTFVQQYWILSSVDRIIWPIVFYCFYIAFGPWMYCEVIDGSYGFVFQHGTFINGMYIPGSLTYVHGFSQLACTQLPLIWLYSKFIAKRYYQVIGMPTKENRSSLRRISKAFFYIIVLTESLLTMSFVYSYGAIATLLSPLRLWGLLMIIVLWRFASNAPQHVLRRSIFVWSGTDKNPSRMTAADETNDNHIN